HSPRRIETRLVGPVQVRPQGGPVATRHGRLRAGHPFAVFGKSAIVQSPQPTSPRPRMATSKSSLGATWFLPKLALASRRPSDRFQSDGGTIPGFPSLIFPPCPIPIPTPIRLLGKPSTA